MTILAVYTVEPNFPAVDQHPDASRYVIGAFWVDATIQEPSAGEVEAFMSPSPATPHLNNGGLVRFSATSPVSVQESLRMAGVTRVAKGRFRATHETSMPSDQYSALVSIFDANPRVARVTARTGNYVEIRVTDLSGVAQDAAEITIKTERVVTP